MTAAEDQLVIKRGSDSVAGTVDRLRAVIEARGLTLFAVVDHSAALAP